MNRHITIGLLVALLVGCSGSGQTDLVAYVKEVKARKAGRIAPIPEVKTFPSYSYKSKDLRDPFKLGTEAAQQRAANKPSNGLAPDTTRNKEPLEAFSLDSLRFVGHLEQHGTQWAIIAAPDGYVYRVKAGNFLGQNYGRITSITESTISIKEIVADGLGGWVERDATMSLAE